ncbi:MAG: tetratricopeptide repeat protein, partial [Candidatus Omnitrophica bacterium]|nr:tetratricopeptide repeat protein [Candidatus Omnitrophota bacterium]
MRLTRSSLPQNPSVKPNASSSRRSFFLKGAIFLLFIPLALFSYNKLFLDSSVEDYKFCLKEINKAYSINEIAGLQAILTQDLINEITAIHPSSTAIMNLEYALRTVTSADKFLQLEALKITLRSLIKEKEIRHGALLASLDRHLWQAGSIFLPRKESYIERKAQENLGQKARITDEINNLLTQLSNLSEDRVHEKQDILFQIGSLNLRIQDMKEAKKFYERAVSVDTHSETANRARFNIAWIDKQSGVQMEKSSSDFSSIIDADPQSLLAMDSRYQMADIYLRQGKYQEAISLFNTLEEKYKGKPVAALCLFQEAATYTYDLNDSENALKKFEQLAKEYPQSFYARYLSQDRPQGLFVTYLVPRAVQVMAWRGAGLMTLFGYSGELVKVKVTVGEESLNEHLNSYMKREVMDSIGNLYVEIANTKVNISENSAQASADITMGQFKLHSEGAGRLEISQAGNIELLMTKVILGGVPVPPILINNTVRNVSLLVRNNFPMIPVSVHIGGGKITAEGYGSRRLAYLAKERLSDFTGLDIEVEEIPPQESAEVYALFK